jgi:hypothetical protein
MLGRTKVGIGMAQFTIADRIWNRACLEDVSDLREGDQALAGMILADGFVMNGGVLHAVEILDYDAQFEDATEGFRYFGWAAVADLLIEARAIFLSGDDTGEDEIALNERYWALLPNDGAELNPRFEAVLRANPSAFAPILDQ